MKKIIKTIFITLLIFLLTSCSNSNIDIKNEDKPSYLVILDYSNDAGKMEVLTISEGETITLPNPEIQYGEFKYWIDEQQNQFTSTYQVTKKVTLTAVYEIDEEAKRIEEVKKLFKEVNTIDINHLLDSDQLIETLYKKSLEYKNESIQIEEIKLVNEYYNSLVYIKDFITRVNNISENVKASDEVKITNARKAYNELDDSLKEQVTSYEETLKLREKSLSDVKEQIKLDIKKIDEEIILLPVCITYDDKDQIDALTKKISLLTNEQKKELTHLDVYTKSLDIINAIEKDTNTITYCLGKDVYSSKVELMTAFFSDFYRFLYYQYGSNILEAKGVYSETDCVNMAMDYYGGRDHCYNLGDNFGSYYLKQSDNDIVQNQPTNKYIGYCYQNGKYLDLIDFLIPFFNYWRLDEKCAKIENNWADFFNSPWASCVDTCKYFYYDENTSYVKTERMIDCLTFCANVVYGTLNTTLTNKVKLNTSISLRGFTFAGWYDNPEFTGSKITEVSNTGKKVILYAKWIENQEQIDKDEADFVEVMIYNLTTYTANVNATTVKYAVDHYNTLSEAAKSQVKNYNDLEKLARKYLGGIEDGIDPLGEELELTIYMNIPEKSFEELKSEFLNDYNTFNNVNYTYDDFMNKNMTLMKMTREFFEDEAMYTKWSWIANYFLTLSLYRGVLIQAKRIVRMEGGDQEYFTKAIGCYFTKTNASDLSYVNFDFSNATAPNQNILKLVYHYTGALMKLSYNGYQFMGYYEEQIYQTKVEKVSKGMVTTLYAYFK